MSDFANNDTSDMNLMTTIIKGAPPDDSRVVSPVSLEITVNGKNKRNTFACIRCHSLKQKCVPSDVHDIYRKPCVRCFKQKKKCTFDLSKRTRKRRKRYEDDSTLEKIDNPSDVNIESTTDQTDYSNHSSHSPKTEFDLPTKSLPISRNLNQINNMERSSQAPPYGFSALSPTSPLATNIDFINGNPLYSSIQIPSDLKFDFQALSGINQKPNKKQRRLSHKTGYHMSHFFKKQLQSLLAAQKGKISEISAKFTNWSNRWNDLVQNGMFIPSISDPISFGIISMEEATLRLEIFKTEISYQSRLPFIKIADEMTVNELRSKKPILFSVIMSIVSISMKENQTNRDTVMKLDSFVINLITNQIFKLNNKSIEVVEALVTLCMWYNFLEWSSNTRYHLFNFICCCLTKDLGPTSVNRSFGMFSDEDPYKYKPKVKTPLELDPNGARLTLLVYISSLNISIFLRQTINSRWTRLTEGACNSLLRQKSVLTPGTDQSLISEEEEGNESVVMFAKLNHLLEKIHVNLHESLEIGEDSEDDPQLFDNYMQRLVKKYKNDLDEIYKKIPKERERLLAFYYSVESYLHQFTVGVYLSRVPDKYASIELPPKIEESFISCYNCCKYSLEAFLKLTPNLIASLPLFHMSRIIYIVGMVLLKLRYAVVAIPMFHHLISLTDSSIELVKQVDNVLAKTSKIYPYNNALYKFQYVISLFGQTYANKVIDLAEAAEESNSLSHFNEKLLMMNKEQHDTTNPKTDINSSHTAVNSLIGISEIRKPTEQNVNTILGLTGQNGISNFDNSNITNKTLQSATNSESKTSPSITSDNLNDYLTDINSVGWGYNALNDEFWTDLFINDI